MKPPVYQCFRRSGRGVFIVLQVRDHQTGEAVNVLDLECYAATAKIDTPFWKTTVPAG